jgi:hypothetical protein
MAFNASGRSTKCLLDILNTFDAIKYPYQVQVCYQEEGSSYTATFVESQSEPTLYSSHGQFDVKTTNANRDLAHSQWQNIAAIGWRASRVPLTGQAAQL